ncbi:hypothetical protein GCM10022415_18840 [Knoellia locipacati]|uniref:DUF1772 domain-containing protein n=1 Tax=Knoellia locipacati TaxID=882824 RepID=A0A512T0S7_9MICO|nr:hypothetical protein [Knoellia locipacati]GEQ13832.1 hypothetical protein KLO01_18790 [Knoellia locipacati]
MTDASGWLVLAAGAHLGFQLTVTLVVYPALADVPPDRWTAAHEAHSRRITPVVGVVYVGLLAAVAAALLREPLTTGTVVAAVAAAVSMALTAAGAAPLHGRLGRGHDPRVLHRLLLVDRLRLVGALACAAGAVVAL